MNDSTASVTWRKINDTTWSNFDVWAGDGMQFYQSDGKAYCKVIIYGSGVPIAQEFVSAVYIKKENEITISIPAKMAKQGMTEQQKPDEFVSVICFLKNGEIIRDENIYKKSLSTPAAN